MPLLIINEPFQLESGEVLSGLEVYYETYGSFQPDSSKVIWVCHALTANADVFDWWPGLFGEKDLFNPRDYFIVCINNLGSCYGTTGPLSNKPETGKPYYHTFPEFTIRDMAKVHSLAHQKLQLGKIHLLIGGSQGAQQAMEWAIQDSDLFENLALIATNAKHSPWGIAFNETQRMAIETDPSWRSDAANAGLQGMKTARAMALLSYRNYFTYQHAQQGKNFDGTPKAVSYQRYQGEKLARRFNALSYYRLSKAMDSHDVGRGRGGLAKALRAIKSNTIVVSILSDLLFPPEEQLFLREHITHAQYAEIDSVYGHDGFLVETQKLSSILKHFLITQNKTTYVKN
ncbi:MAG: homoserine O-acetyltransferase [Flavobacteriales bacterium]